MLAIGRALMTRPEVLMLDEPSMGLSPILVEKIFEIVKAINDQGTTVLLVEQNRSEEHTSELQSHSDLVCRLLLEKKKKTTITSTSTTRILTLRHPSPATIQTLPPHTHDSSLRGTIQRGASSELQYTSLRLARCSH